MKVSIEKTEHYTLFSLSNQEVDETAIAELLDEAKKTLEQKEVIYFIFDLNPLKEIDQNFIQALQDITEALVNEAGLLINVHHEPAMLSQFEEHQLLLVPKLEEAIEYIYMDQLEKQFLGDNDD